MIIRGAGNTPPEQVTQLAIAWLSPGVTVDEAIAQIGIAPRHEEHARGLWALWTRKAAEQKGEAGGNA